LVSYFIDSLTLLLYSSLTLYLSPFLPHVLSFFLPLCFPSFLPSSVTSFHSPTLLHSYPSFPLSLLLLHSFSLPIIPPLTFFSLLHRPICPLLTWLKRKYSLGSRTYLPGFKVPHTTPNTPLYTLYYTTLHCNSTYCQSRAVLLYAL
jgi:hypothetical protein